MEFRYRAGDERTRSPPPPLAASSGSVRREIPAGEDGHGGDGGTGDYGGDSTVVPWQPSSPVAAVGSDELRRAMKEKIRERILREEAEHWELEAEVRRELMEQIFPLLRRYAGNAATMGAAPSAGTTALQADSKANALASTATLPAKRKNPATAAASTASGATSSKRPKPDLTCACDVCGITSTSEKAMQDHLNGKGHKKKVAVLALSAPAEPKPESEPEQEVVEEDPAASTVPASDGGYRPTKLSMLTSAGVMYEVLQMDGYLLCEECNVRTADRVTMMCHLEGGKHVSKAMKLKQQAGKPRAAAAAAPKKCIKEPATAAAAAAGGEPRTVVVEVDGEKRPMRTLEGFLVCVVCDVKAPSVTVMQSHLAGRKHKAAAKAKAKAKAKAEAAASVAGKIGEKLEVQETGVMAIEDVATNVDHDAGGDAPGEETKKVARPVPAGSSDVFDSLYCTCCKVRVTSESDMRIHLGGRKHKNKSKLEQDTMAVATAKAKSKETSTATASPLPAPRGDAAHADRSMAPTEVNQPAKTRDGATPATDADKAAAEAKSTTTAAATRQQVKIQVEGRMFVVLRQKNGTLLCESCGVHCSGKTDMVLHLYTREHWDKCGARQPEVEKKKPATVVAPPPDGGE